MILFPAIDLKDGQCVRLRQGEMEQATVFNVDPSAQAAAARDLAAAYGQAADVIAATSTPAALKAVKRRLVDGLARLAHGYRKLARGAAEQNASGYEEGRCAVDRAEGDLEHGLNRIQEAPG